MNSKEKITIADDVKIEIVRTLVEPSYKDDIQRMLQGRTCWRITGQIFETVSKILVAMGCILSFSSGYYDDRVLSLIAGSVSTVSLATLQFSSFSYKESKKQSEEVNILLQKLNIDTLPVINRDSEYLHKSQISDKNRPSASATPDSDSKT